MRYWIIAISMLLYAALPAPVEAQVGIAFQSHDVSIGINMPVYPRLVSIPGYPVYYDPRADSNYFFYDGMYWVYQNDNWYASSWYNGPWDEVGPQYVPEWILRVPVRYYRHRPAYFNGWSINIAPRWGQHWGRDWERNRRGWDKWDRRSIPHAAPLPTYQREYSGRRYPRQANERNSILSTHYQYQPHSNVTRQYFQRQNSGSRTRSQQSQIRDAQKSRAAQQSRTRDAQKSRAAQQSRTRDAQKSRAAQQSRARDAQKSRAAQQSRARDAQKSRAAQQSRTRDAQKSRAAQQSQARDAQKSRAAQQSRTRDAQNSRAAQQSRARDAQKSSSPQQQRGQRQAPANRGAPDQRS
ncbi:MAG: hypothetical protein WBV39_09015, partial [Rudaea sp.]